jgi:Cytochrome P460
VRTLRALALTVVLLTPAACGGSDEPEPEPAARPTSTAEEAPAPTDATTTEEETAEPAPARALPGLPDWTAGYRGWTKLNAAPLAPREADPHLGTKNVFASRPRGEDGTFPVGTIVVKEGFRPDKDFVGLIATMRKLEGMDPEHNDWVFVEWDRGAASDDFEILARDDVCTGCHSGVADQDYVFTRQ